MSQSNVTVFAGQPVIGRTEPVSATYDGMLAGLVSSVDDGWSFEGASYDTPADEHTVIETVYEALSEPDGEAVKAAAKMVFSNPRVTYTAQVLTAMAAAYASECADGDGVDAVVAILQEAARRIAVIEALTI